MKNTINTTFSINQLSWLYLRTVTKINWIQILFQAFSKIQNDHLKPENSLHIKFVLSCMINNVVFMKIRHFYSACSSRASPFPNTQTPLGQENSLYDTLMAKPWGEWPSSHSAGYYKIHKLIRCLFIHYGSIPDAWPVTRRIYVIFLIHIRNLESVLTNDGKVSPISIIEVQIQFFQYRENISLNLRLIKRKIREKIGKSCLYDNLIILD